MLGLWLLLSSCSSLKTKATHVNEVLINESDTTALNDERFAEPRVTMPMVHNNEQHSKYGNPIRYKVMGKVYNVRPSTKGYREKGIASWYGPKFHHQRTSSGEVYNMYEMTAAHKTLPLPTYVRVKNLENGKKIIVKVNDRGPFHEGRIIDLSFSAAKALGIDKQGLGHVLVETMNTGNSKAKYFIQVGAFSNAGSAFRFIHYLRSFINFPVEIQKSQKLHLVYIGPIATQKKGLEVKKQLGEKGVSDSFTYLM
jgi:rare lipoprotein A